MVSISHKPREFVELGPLCDIPDEGRAFELQQDSRKYNIVVIPTSNGPVAYINRCPHTGVNLEWMPDRFLDRGGDFIQCATHGAKFRIHDGYCVFGPCAGDSLQPVPVRVIAGRVQVALPDNGA